jgi:uncharacterized protein YjbI with pentapeptide repeats
MAERRRHGFWRLVLWTIGGVGVLLLVVFAVLIGPWLFTKNLHRLDDAERLKAQNDVRTTLVQALAGLGVAAGVIVAYRTYRQNQIEQERTYRQRLAEEERRQAEQDRTYQQSQAEQDRTHERELYAKAVEQLGHSQAPVRLGALYSLESLAQDKPERRQTIVDVLCAYLRMPYSPPAQPDTAAELGASPQPSTLLPSIHDPAQELQVRQTAQRLLATHLRHPPDTSGEDAQRRRPSPDETFWPHISLDLTGAILVEFSLQEASVVRATFSKTTFAGRAQFDRVTFTGDARFGEAIFIGDAQFSRATFTGIAWFTEATFAGGAAFSDATFTGTAWFPGATFTGDAWFHNATFTGDAWFNNATFTRTASFSGTTFAGNVGMNGATFTGDYPVGNRRPSWPPGWTVRPDPAEPSRRTLVRKDPEPSEASPSED